MYKGPFVSTASALGLVLCTSFASSTAFAESESGNVEGPRVHCGHSSTGGPRRSATECIRRLANFVDMRKGGNFAMKFHGGTESACS